MNSNFGFVRVAAAVPTMRVADCRYNAEQVKVQIDESIEQGVEVICFPELTVTGYTCADLFFTQQLQQSCMRGCNRAACGSWKRYVTTPAAKPSSC